MESKANREPVHSQPTMPATEPTHALGLDAGHPKEILRVSEVGGQLRELRVQLCLQDEGRSLAKQ